MNEPYSARAKNLLKLSDESISIDRSCVPPLVGKNSHSLDKRLDAFNEGPVIRGKGTKNVEAVSVNQPDQLQETTFASKELFPQDMSHEENIYLAVGGCICSMNPPYCFWIWNPSAFGLSIVHVMRQGIDLFVPLDIGIIVEIGSDIKARPGISPFASSKIEIMEKWIQTGRRHIVILGQVPDRIEPLVRLPGLAIFHGLQVG